MSFGQLQRPTKCTVETAGVELQSQEEKHVDPTGSASPHLKNRVGNEATCHNRRSSFVRSTGYSN